MKQMSEPPEMDKHLLGEEPYDLIQPVLELELSAKLAPTLLCLDDENGGKRQYRLTNKSSDGRKLYFRCSRCDTVVKVHIYNVIKQKNYSLFLTF
jgi:hypothetical protein